MFKPEIQRYEKYIIANYFDNISLEIKNNGILPLLWWCIFWLKLSLYFK